MHPPAPAKCYWVESKFRPCPQAFRQGDSGQWGGGVYLLSIQRQTMLVTVQNAP